jgi:hypothetical protein
MSSKVAGQVKAQEARPVPSGGQGLLQQKCGCSQNGFAGGGSDACCGHDAGGLSQRAGVNRALPFNQEGLGSRGEPLHEETRKFMQASFAHDFSRVRVHTDASAAASARSVNSYAYTVGQHVVFGAEQYQPGTQEGQKLIAHELTHVVQQGRAGTTRLDRKSLDEAALGPIQSDDPDELQAETIAARITHRGQAGAWASPAKDLARTIEGTWNSPRLIGRSGIGSVPNTPAPAAGTSIAPKAIESNGHPLDRATRSFMESRFGHDFSRVRVHTDTSAAESARTLGAQAYTVGHDLVFGPGRYAPETASGMRLLAHELTHVVQQSFGGGNTPSPAPRSALELECERVSRAIDTSGTSLRVALRSGIGIARNIEVQDLSKLSDAELNAEHNRVVVWLSKHTAAELDYAPTRDYLESIENESRRRFPATPGQTSVPGTPGSEKVEPTQTATAAPSQAPAAGGFVSGAITAAPCPAAPAKTELTSTCALPAPAKGTAPPVKETPLLPALSTAKFGGDAVIAKYARQLAECHAARVVQEVVDKRFKGDVEKAKKEATAEAKEDTKKSIADSAVGIDPKDKKALATAQQQATQEAQKAAARKIAERQAAVTKPDVATVQKELADKFEEELAADYTLTMQAAVGRFGGNWLARMKRTLDGTKAKLIKEKNAKPKVKKGETAPPVRPADEINAEIEAEMIKARCEQDAWVADQIEGVKRGWMVGRREQLDFETINQNVPELKDFKPARAVPEAERVDIPESLKSDATMPGVAPELKDFLVELEKLEPNYKAGNYSGHGGGSWAGAGFSVDLYLSGKDSGHDNRGFWQHAAAVRFLLHLNDAAVAVGARWRVLYNDFGVAEEVNHATGKRNVGFMGNVMHGGLNWHGPAPMILHFHLDIEIPPPAPPAKKPEAQPAAQPAAK